MNKREILRRAVIAVSVVVIAILVITAVARHRTVEQAETASVQEGTAYLKQLEGGDVSTVKDDIAKVQQEKLQAQKEARLQELESGKVDVWSLFQNYAILGDSRAVGFYYYEFLPQERVLAEGGDTIRNIDSHMSELETLNPTMIVFSYGINDVSIGYWKTPEEYTTEYAQILEKVHQALPNARLYVNSIIPAQDKAIAIEGSWANIPKFNDALKQMCDTYGYGFVDISQCVEEHQDLYDVGDGIHMQKAFYPYWAAYIMTEVYSDTGEAYKTPSEAVTSSSESVTADSGAAGEDSETVSDSGTVSTSS